MINKIHNKTFFVAALSVYLGLLIVGAPPQVLAQSFLTKNDNVISKNHRAIAEAELHFLQTDFKAVEEYAEIAENLIKISKLITPYNFAFETRTNPEFEGISVAKILRKPTLFPEKTRSKLDNEVKKLNVVFPKAYRFDDVRFLTTFQLDSSGLSLPSKFLQNSHSEAFETSSAYQASLESLKRNTLNEAKLLIYENTRSFAENDQVFIVTRLPRAALRSLFTADEKAN